MAEYRSRNRKVLVSVFNSQEAREAVLGGGRIIDSEDPRSALGNIKPRQIMQISDAVLNYSRDMEIQLSTNIGEDQLLFDRSETGQAIEKSPYEIAGKAAQSAIGVACAMGTRVHPCNWVKVGVDGMMVGMVREVLEEVVLTLNRTEQFSHCQVMAVLFVQDMALWNERKRDKSVREILVELREFHPCGKEDPDAFDIRDYAVGTLRDRNGIPLFADRGQVSLGALIKSGVLPEGSNHGFVKLNELFPHRRYFPQIAHPEQRTNREMIKAMIDVTADSGADAIMLDTRIQTKVARLCLVDTSSDGFIDINRFDIRDGLPRRGILTLDEIEYFVDYCHYRGIEANAAGSVQSYQAQQLWLKIPELDQVSTRGAASGVELEPGTDLAGSDTRQHRVVKRALVRGLAPPEHGGAINFPASMKESREAAREIKALCAELAEERKRRGLPGLESFFVDKYGVPEPVL